MRFSPGIYHNVLRRSTLSTPRRFASSSTVNPEEIAFFSRLSSQWWDESGEFAFLHKMNPVRMQFIREKLLEAARDEQPELLVQERENSGAILGGLDVLDVGCGGGLLCESLCRLGARTLGIDASASNIGVATAHASSDPDFAENSTRPGTLLYTRTSAEDLLEECRQFDVVFSMEVLEHVDNPAHFLRTCSALVKPGGHLFLSTISRTPLAYMLTILAAEHLFRFVTPGTHTYEKFIKPSELLDFFSKPSPSLTCRGSSPMFSGRPWITHLYNGRPTRQEAEIRGLMFIPWKSQWMLAPRDAFGATDCNYIAHFRKPFDN